MQTGEVKHKYLQDGNVVTIYKSEVGSCSFFSYEAKTSVWMKKKREQLQSTRINNV